jgi:hypothetical protein
MEELERYKNKIHCEQCNKSKKYKTQRILNKEFQSNDMK